MRMNEKQREGQLYRSGKRAGVTVEGDQVSCDKCGTGWYPPIKRGGGWRHGWRVCPNGCNADRLSN